MNCRSQKCIAISTMSGQGDLMEWPVRTLERLLCAERCLCAGRELCVIPGTVDMRNSSLHFSAMLWFIRLSGRSRCTSEGHLD
jgi:hypothetical protein